MESLKLKSMFNLRLSVFLIIFISTAPCFSAIEKKINFVISTVEKKYSIRLAYENMPKATWDEIKYTVASKSDYERLLKYLRLFRREFNKYPKEFIRESRLKWVVFVKDLSISGQLRTAVPDYKKEILFLDFARGTHSTIYQRHVIHHEFYHMIEEQFNGDAYWKDPNWAKFNDKNFKYGKGGATVQGQSNVYELTHPKKGFINLYSMSALEEDKAEIFASLFVKAESRKIAKCVKKDDILRKKVRYMKTFLFKCCKDMNPQYWVNYKVAISKNEGVKPSSETEIKENHRVKPDSR